MPSKIRALQPHKQMRLTWPRHIRRW